MTGHPQLVDLVERTEDPEVRAHLDTCPPCRARAKLVSAPSPEPDALPGIEAARQALSAARSHAARSMSAGSMPTAEVDAGLLPGTSLGRYVVEGLLGRGGMGSVYRVRHTQLGSAHALKVLHRTSPSERARLIREGRAQGRLRHPNVTTVTDVVEVEGAPGLIIELVDGPSLYAWLREHGRADGETLDRLGREILRGVAAAHQAGLVHRDLKPANVLLSPQDDGFVAKVADFGLARLVAGKDEEGQPPLTRPGTPLGTPSYMAPEQIVDATRSDARSDVFSLGAVLYELATGERAFPGERAIDVWDAVRAGRHVPVAKRVPELPARMAATIERALSVDPAARFASAAEMLDAWRGDRAAVLAGARLSRGWIGLGGAVCAVVVGAVLLATRGGAELAAESPAVRERRVTALSDELQIYAVALSDDGKLLAFSDSRGLWLQDAERGQARQVLDQGPYNNLDFRPGGDGLVAWGMRGGEDALWSVGFDGSTERLLEGTVRVARLSPGGERLAYADATGLWVATLADGQRTRIRPLAATDTPLSLAWSPSGRAVALVNESTTHDGAWLEITAADGSSTRVLLEDRRLVALGMAPLAWIGPDRLVFGRARAKGGMGVPGVELLALDGAETAASAATARVVQSWDGFHITHLHASRDGARVVMARFTGKVLTYGQALRDAGPDATPRRLGAEEWQDEPFGWLDADHVLLGSRRPDLALYSQPWDGGPATRIRELGDGSHVATVWRDQLLTWALSGPGGAEPGSEGWTADRLRLALRREPVLGGPAEVLAELEASGPISVERHRVVCRGDRCLVSLPETGALTFRWLAPGRGEVGPVILRVPTTSRSLSWDLAPDGHRLALLTAEPGRLEIQDLGGGPSTSLPVALSYAGHVAWAPGPPDHWYAAGLLDGSDHPYRVWSLGADGSAAPLWASMNGYLNCPTPSPDGSRLAYAGFMFDGDLWLVDGLFSGR